MPRAITKFALTIPHFSHKDVLEIVLQHELLCTTYCISSERHATNSTNTDADEHIHAYFELNPEVTDTDINTVRERLHCGLQAVADQAAPNGFDIQSAKRPDKWLKYITKVSSMIETTQGGLPPWTPQSVINMP